MKAILINSKARIVHNVEIDGLEDMRQLLECRTVAAPIELDNGDTVWIDDEGMYNPRDFFELEGYEPIAGNALIIGTTELGDNADCKTSVTEIDHGILFIDLATLQLKYRLRTM